MKINYCTLLSTILLLSFLISCDLKNAKKSKHPYLIVYAQNFGKYDSLLFRKFEKEEKIRVYVKKCVDSLLIQNLLKEKYNANADLLLFSNYENAIVAKNNKLLAVANSEIIKKNIDDVYRSKSNYWFALSKSPLVLIYNENYLKRDTITSYFEIIQSRWKNKFAIQDEKSETLTSFKNTIQLILKGKGNIFISKFFQQTYLPKTGNDKEQIMRIARGEAYLAIIKLSSLIQCQMQENNKIYSKVKVIFPNQKKKGAYLSITAGGIYRYAQNYTNALKLLEFLSSKRAQFKYAAGRYQVPVLKGINWSREVMDYGKFRGRFYRKRAKI